MSASTPSDLTRSPASSPLPLWISPDPRYHTPSPPSPDPASPTSRVAPDFDPSSPDRDLDTTGRFYLESPSPQPLPHPSSHSSASSTNPPDPTSVAIRLTLTFYQTVTLRAFRARHQKVSRLRGFPEPDEGATVDDEFPPASWFPHYMMPWYALASDLLQDYTYDQNLDAIDEESFQPFDARPRGDHHPDRVYVHNASPGSREELAEAGRIAAEKFPDEIQYTARMALTTPLYPLTSELVPGDAVRAGLHYDLRPLLDSIGGEGSNGRFGFVLPGCSMAVHLRQLNGKPLPARDTTEWLAMLGMFEPALDGLRPFRENARLLPALLRDWRTLQARQVPKVVHAVAERHGIRGLADWVMDGPWANLSNVMFYEPKRLEEYSPVARAICKGLMTTPPVSDHSRSVSVMEELTSLDLKHVYWWAVMHGTIARFAREVAAAGMRLDAETVPVAKPAAGADERQMQIVDDGEALPIGTLMDLVGLDLQQTYHLRRLEATWWPEMEEMKRTINRLRRANGEPEIYNDLGKRAGVYSRGAGVWPERWVRPEGVVAEGLEDEMMLD